MKSIFIKCFSISLALITTAAAQSNEFSELTDRAKSISQDLPPLLSGAPQPSEVNVAANAIEIGEAFCKQAYIDSVPAKQAVLFARGYEYFSRAHEILDRERSDLLLAEGWLKARHSLKLDEALAMLEEGLRLNPDNPIAYFKVAFLTYDKYKFSLPKFTKNPQKTMTMPDGTVVHLEPVYSVYSESNDNALLEKAQELAEKAIELDPKFANAYNLLATIHNFRNEREIGKQYYYQFYDNIQHLNMELIYYSEDTRDNWTKAAAHIFESRISAE